MCCDSPTEFEYQNRPNGHLNLHRPLSAFSPVHDRTITTSSRLQRRKTWSMGRPNGLQAGKVPIGTLFIALQYRVAQSFSRKATHAFLSPVQPSTCDHRHFCCHRRVWCCRICRCCAGPSQLDRRRYPERVFDQLRRSRLDLFSTMTSARPRAGL